MAIDSLLNKYDIYYIEPGATKLGFMLAQNRNKTKVWRRDDERALPDSFAAGDISYANLSPDISKVISHRYMHGGLGALEFEVEDDAAFQILRYLRSQNVDLRCKGKAYPGPKIDSVTIPVKTTPTIVNADFELDSDWTTEYGDAERSNVDKHGGTYSWHVGSTDPSAAYQDITWNSAYRGREFVFKCWIKCVGVGTSYIQIDDGVGVTSTSDASIAWKQLTVTRTLDDAATRLRLRIRSTNPIDVYFDDATLTVTTFPNPTPVAFANFNGEIYFASGDMISKLNGAGDEFEHVHTLPQVITDIVAFIDDYLYIAVAAANKYWYMDAAEDFTQTALDNGEADSFCKVGTDLWQLKLPNKIRKATDPIAGPWAAEILVGEAAYDVNDMESYLGYLYCLKEDGPYYEDGAGAIVQPFPSLVTIAHADAGKNSDVFRNRLYFRMGNQQEWEIDGSTLTEVTPSDSAPGISQYAYECVARAHDEQWVYAIIERGANDLAILAGRWEYISGRTRWIWHEIRSIDLTGVAIAFVSSVEGRPYLYLGSTATGESVYKVYLPVTKDATADSGYKFHTAGSLWTPRYMSLLYAVDKRWLELFTRSLNLSGTNYINAYYSTDDGASFDLLKKLDTSPEQTEAFTNIEETMMNLRFDFVGDSDTVPPVLKYHNLKALTIFPSVSRFRHTVRCANGLLLKGNHVATPSYSYDAIRTFIDGLRDKVCTLGDRFGTEHTVLVRAIQELEVFDEGTGKPELHYSLEAVKL